MTAEGNFILTCILVLSIVNIIVFYLIFLASSIRATLDGFRINIMLFLIYFKDDFSTCCLKVKSSLSDKFYFLMFRFLQSKFVKFEIKQTLPV